MRFLTVVILSISLAAAAEPAPKSKTQAQSVKKLKASRAKSFFRAVGSFGVGMVVVDPYTETVVKKSSR